MGEGGRRSIEGVGRRDNIGRKGGGEKNWRGGDGMDELGEVLGGFKWERGLG